MHIYVAFPPKAIRLSAKRLKALPLKSTHFHWVMIAELRPNKC